MSRPVQMRASYRDDAAFLLRLETAVSKDIRKSELWRSQVCLQIRSLVQTLLQVEAPADAKKQR